jgi:hypothetical protein
MIKKFYEFRSGNDTEISEPVTKPVTIPRPIRPDKNPYENPIEEPVHPYTPTPNIEPEPLLKKEQNVINKLKEVLKEKGMTLEDLYNMCVDL